MKNVIVTLIFFCISVSTYSQKTLDDYFYKQGVKVLAGLAHPTNTYVRGTYWVGFNTVYITIYYDQGYYTKLELKKDNPFFSNIVVTEDNDFVNPFVAIEVLKDALLEALKDDPEKEENRSRFERRFEKKLQDMSGIEIACLFLSLDWLDFKSSGNN